jgi:phage-related protein
MANWNAAGQEFGLGPLGVAIVAPEPPRSARVIFIVDGLGIVVLNGFIKKSQKTPPREIELAKDRLKEFDR